MGQLSKYADFLSPLDRLVVENVRMWRSDDAPGLQTASELLGRLIHVLGTVWQWLTEVQAPFGPFWPPLIAFLADPHPIPLGSPLRATWTFLQRCAADQRRPLLPPRLKRDRRL